MIVAIIGVLLLIGVFFLGIRLAQKHEDKIRADLDLTVKELLEVESKKPAFCVEFHVNGSIQRTKDLKTKVDSWLNIDLKPRTQIFTSEQRAGELLEESYSRGYFKCATGITYPACNITRAAVVQSYEIRK